MKYPKDMIYFLLSSNSLICDWSIIMSWNTIQPLKIEFRKLFIKSGLQNHLKHSHALQKISPPLRHTSFSAQAQKPGCWRRSKPRWRSSWRWTGWRWQRSKEGFWCTKKPKLMHFFQVRGGEARPGEGETESILLLQLLQSRLRWLFFFC